MQEQFARLTRRARGLDLYGEPVLFNRFVFVVRYQGLFDRLVPIEAPEIVIGRDTHCGLRLVHDCVSRAHARIARTDRGYTIRDLCSRNHTLINQRRATDHHLLQEWDVVRIVPFALKVFLDQEAAEADAAMLDESTKSPALGSAVIDVREEMKQRLHPALHSVYDSLMDGCVEKDIIRMHRLKQAAAHYAIRRIYKALDVHSQHDLMSRCTRHRP